MSPVETSASANTSLITEAVITEYFRCPACQHPNLKVIPFETAGQGLVNAVVVCESCSVWYRLEDGLLELLNGALRDQHAADSFQTRFSSRWDGWTGNARGVVSHPSDDHKLEQKGFYDQDAIQYETNMLQLPFWKAFDKTYLRNAPETNSGDVLIEIGGGTGRMSLPLLDRFKVILSFDLSESMVRAALRNKKALGARAAHAYYFVSDAENIPLKSGKASVASLSGILHHVESPHLVIREMARVLRPGGRFFGNENNKSAFRFVFDLLMRINKLWNEKAHEEHFIISHRELRRWFKDAGVSARIWTTVFLPPHVFNLFHQPSALQLLVTTDSISRALPWLRYQGGLILYSGVKPAA